MNSFDIVVIGAGIIGSSVAYYLSKEGYSVALVEKGDVANGTSSRCDAVALICDKKPGIDTAIGFKSIQLYKELAKEFSFDFEFFSRGSLYVCETDQELDIARDYVAQQVAAGYEMRMVDRQELPDIEPHLARDLKGGIWTEVDSTMNPYLVCYAFIEEAKKYGLTLFTNHEVREIVQAPDGRIESVKTDRTTIHTKRIVNCAGVWAGKIGEMVGIDIPIRPRKGLILITEKTKKVVNQKVHEFGYMLSKFEDIHYKRNVSQLVEDHNIAFTIEPTEAHNFLVGGHRAFKGYNIRSEHDVMRGIAERAIRFFPVLKDIHCIRAYAGIRPWVVDHLPIVSEVEEVPGFYIASGHEGDGISMAPITGKMVAQLISNQETDFNIDRLNFSRYKNGAQEQTV
ncbi:NAD(P)/FAD-dependent oxidoreductase [Bacillus inaquosorum]|uniref:NAD(P)/FAD-dependent oxidoreductase n=1 Tax=Bacillus inaquosorum TaxID=483913 RepID=UPI002E09EE2B|nr:FAD-dependent oxidoreductase [Bacillus inaquosorum]MED1196496.1 FAD-dependent oxidoreductase [Bacillus inaquosorum]MED1222776.1 FAD-dependent oxidoreductase [Bacillus inaquosorum]